MSFIALTPLFKRGKLLTVLDIGSTKVACTIARLYPCKDTKYLYGRTHKTEILGFGACYFKGMKAGNILDMTWTERAIRQAVDEAEQEAGVVVESVLVNFSGRSLQTVHVQTQKNLTRSEVEKRDIEELLQEASHRVLKDKAYNSFQVLHALPVRFSLDGLEEVYDPLGMVGQCLQGEVHVVVSERAALQNLERCINNAHLTVEAFVATPLASGLAVLGEDEARLGAACIDLGGSTTSLAVFGKDRFLYADILPVGGEHITTDIACGFSITLQQAERLKIVHGSAFYNDMDDHCLLSVLPSLSNGEKQHTRSSLNRIIIARMEEILELIRDRLHYSGYAQRSSKNIILTGGGAQLPGITDLAQKILGHKVRIGRPLGVASLPESAKTACFATLTGLLVYPQSRDIEEKTLRLKPQEKNMQINGHFYRMGQWLRKNF